MIDKTVSTVAEAVAPIHDGAVVMIGGFGSAGSPVELLHALIDQGTAGLTAINNNTGNGEVGLASLIRNRQVRKMSPRSVPKRRLRHRRNHHQQRPARLRLKWQPR